MKNELELYNPWKEDLKKAVKNATTLKIKNINDKIGYKTVHEKEMELKKYRVDIVKTCKTYTDQWEKKKKEAWEIRDMLLNIIKPVELELKEKKKEIDDEKKRLEEEERIFLQNRLNILAKYNKDMDLLQLKSMSPEDFENIIEIEEKIKQKQQEEEKEKIKLQQEKEKKLEEDQRKLEEEKQKIQQEKDKLENEKRRIEEDKQKIIDEQIKKTEVEKQAKQLAKQLAIKKQQEELIKKDKLAKKKKYQKFLEDNDWNYDWIQQDNTRKVVTLWKKVNEFNF